MTPLVPVVEGMKNHASVRQTVWRLPFYQESYGGPVATHTTSHCFTAVKAARGRDAISLTGSDSWTMGD